MKITVKTRSGGWFATLGASSSAHEEEFYVVRDANGDKLLAVATDTIEAVLYDYAED